MSANATTQFRYLENRKGQRVIDDFRRLLESGDVEKLTRGVYHELHMHGGFIAHFGIEGFRSTFRGKLSSLLDGEMCSLEEAEQFRWPALEDSGYTDGLSSGDVLRGIAEIAADLGPMVRARETGEATEQELKVLFALAERHGFELVKKV